MPLIAWLAPLLEKLKLAQASGALGALGGGLKDVAGAGISGIQQIQQNPFQAAQSGLQQIPGFGTSTGVPFDIIEGMGGAAKGLDYLKSAPEAIQGASGAARPRRLRRWWWAGFHAASPATPDAPAAPAAGAADRLPDDDEPGGCGGVGPAVAGREPAVCNGPVGSVPSPLAADRPRLHGRPQERGRRPRRSPVRHPAWSWR